MSTPIICKSAPQPVGLYPHARQAGRILWLSGVGPRKLGSETIPGVTLDAAGNIVSYDIVEQCHSMFDNVRCILEESGAGWDNLVDVTVFLVNMKQDFKTFNKIYAEYFASHQPCRTTIGVTALPTPIAVEVKCVAVLP